MLNKQFVGVVGSSVREHIGLLKGPDNYSLRDCGSTAIVQYCHGMACALVCGIRYKAVSVQLVAELRCVAKDGIV